MNSIEIRLRENVAGISSLALAVGGTIAAILLSPWWWIVVPPGIAGAFRLTHNEARRRLAALKRSGAAVAWGEHAFFGIIDGVIVSGALAPSHVAAFEKGAEAPGNPVDDLVLRRWKGTPPAWRRVPIGTVERVESTTGEKTFRLILPAAVEEFAFQFPHERDAALELLRAAAPWTVTETGRSVARLELLSLVMGLPLVFFSAALALAALGIVQPNQLPLLDWKGVGQVRGRGRAIAAAWANASRCFLWLLDTLPAAASVAIGILATVAFGTLIYASQWTRIMDTVWTRADDVQRADPGTVGATGVTPATPSCLP